MSAETELYSALTGDATVAGLVAARVYPDLIPAGSATPCIAFVRSGTEYVSTIHGTTLAGKATLEVYVLADTREAADSLAASVVAGISDNGFVVVNRRAETEGEDGDSYESTVLTVEYWE